VILKNQFSFARNVSNSLKDLIKRKFNNANNAITVEKQKRIEGPISSSTPRGALKLEISTSTPVVSAGKEFSIYVVIRNPFLVPVTLHSTETHIPIELSDEIWRKQYNSKIKNERLKSISNAINSFQKFFLRVKYWLSDLQSSIRSDPGPRVAIAVSPEVYDEISRLAPVAVSLQDVTGRDIQISGIKMGDSWDLNFSELSPNEIKNIPDSPGFSGKISMP